MFERYTELAREVVVGAHQAAREMGHAETGSDHLLLSLLENGSEVLVRLMAESARVPDSRLREMVASRHHRRSLVSAAIPFTHEASRVLDAASQEAAGLGSAGVADTHLLLAILGEPSSRGASLLCEVEVDDDILRASLRQLPGANAPTLSSRLPRADERQRITAKLQELDAWVVAWDRRQEVFAVCAAADTSAEAEESIIDLLGLPSSQARSVLALPLSMMTNAEGARVRAHRDWLARRLMELGP